MQLRMLLPFVPLCICILYVIYVMTPGWFSNFPGLFHIQLLCFVYVFVLFTGGFLHVCVRGCVCGYMYTYMYEQTPCLHTDADMCACICVHTNTFIHVCSCACVCMYVHIYKYTYKDTRCAYKYTVCAYKCMRICLYLHVRVCVYIHIYMHAKFACGCVYIYMYAH